MNDPIPDSLISRLSREPTVHFLLIAGFMFAAYGLRDPESGSELAIDWREVEARILVTELNTGQTLSPEERLLVEESVVDDYILVNEALRIGLQNDPRINDILVQKMRHVLSAELIQPSDQELQSAYDANLERYQLPARLSLDELVFASRDPLPEDLITALRSGSTVDALPTSMIFTLSSLPRVSHQDLASIFSREFADAIFAANESDWVGPHISNRGQHWLRIREHFEASQLAFEDVVEQVRLDWIASVEEQRLKDLVTGLRSQYRVIITNRPAQ